MELTLCQTPRPFNHFHPLPSTIKYPGIIIHYVIFSSPVSLELKVINYNCIKVDDSSIFLLLIQKGEQW